MAGHLPSSIQTKAIFTPSTRTQASRPTLPKHGDLGDRTGQPMGQGVAVMLRYPSLLQIVVRMAAMKKGRLAKNEALVQLDPESRLQRMVLVRTTHPLVDWVGQC